MTRINGYKKLLEHKKYLKVHKTRFNRTNARTKGTVVNFYTAEAKQPNSGNRNCVRVKIKKLNKTVLAYIPYCGSKKFIKLHDIVEIESIGGAHGRSMGDLSACAYKVVKINGIALKQLFLNKKKI